MVDYRNNDKGSGNLFWHLDACAVMISMTLFSELTTRLFTKFTSWVHETRQSLIRLVQVILSLSV